MTDFCTYCPFVRGCEHCPSAGGEIPTVATVSDAGKGAATGRLRGYETAPGVALTNTEGLTHSDVTGRADHMVANPHPRRIEHARGGADA